MLDFFKRRRTETVETTAQPEPISEAPTAPIRAPLAVTIQAPPRHPRVSQLIRLETARLRQVEQLAEIEKGKEAEAEPIALEIEHLEAKGAENVKAAIGLTDKATAAEMEIAEVEEQIGVLCRRVEALRESIAGVDRDLATNATERADLDAALTDARERFAQVSTTSTGRSIARSIAKIEKQQKTIVDRNPGARFFRLEMAIDAEAERLGLRALVRAVTEHLKTKEFSAAISAKYRETRARLKADPSEFEVQEMALDILRAKSIETEHVDLIARRTKGAILIETRGITDVARSFCLSEITRRKAALECAAADPPQVDASVAA